MRILFHRLSEKFDQLIADLFPRSGDESGYGNY